MRIRIVVAGLLLSLAALTPVDAARAAGLVPIADDQWNQIAVRKVLHVFAYGGGATDKQIQRWANIGPQAAIREMLTFAPVNDKLSSGGDAIGERVRSLEDLQVLLSADRADNPVCHDQRPLYALTTVRKDEGVIHSNAGMQNAWIKATQIRGSNPFRARVGLWLTDYHAAVGLHGQVGSGLLRHHYDSMIDALAANRPFDEVLATAATSAAVAFRYRHYANRFHNDRDAFYGNDDFAREFHQLYFRITGETEDADYHENTTIENTARALTGMRIDRDPTAYGITVSKNWRVAPIDFSDHTDPAGTLHLNTTLHHWGDLEILRRSISGATAEKKLFALAKLAIRHPESLDNLPVAIVAHFADDNLTATKERAIRDEWRKLAGRPGDLLDFLRAYAISTTFHRRDTVKYRTAFDRNLTLFNLNTVDAEEVFGNPATPAAWMRGQGAEPFAPTHGIFGGQIGLEAANSAAVYRQAYGAAVVSSQAISQVTSECRSPSGRLVSRWQKDWAKVIPATDGDYTVKAVGRWLWQRLIADGAKAKTYGPLERAFVAGFLARGLDFGYLADPKNPEATISTAALGRAPLAGLLRTLEGESIALASRDRAEREEANRRVGMAINFISMTPFMFALEGR
ncbi:MAG: DUF1800 family protein [Rhodospirillales bacterium]